MKVARSAACRIGVAALALVGAVGCSSNTPGNTENPGDSGLTDAGPSDAKAPDSSVSDGSASDAMASDSSVTDGSVTDGSVDGGAPEIVYANSGASLGVFNLGADGTLTALAPTTLPQILQYGWFDSTSSHFYAGATTGTENYLYAFSVSPTTGLPTAIGSPLLSPNGRVINLTLSGDNKYLLSVHNVTETYSVFAIASDATIGALVPPPDGGDTAVGTYLHQIRVDPTGQYVTICDRGNDPSTATGADGGVVTTPEELGHLLVYTFSAGVLTPLQNIAFPTGIGPRHLDFHPTKPWVYLSAERGNRLITYTMSNGMLTQAFDTSSLAVAADQPPLNTSEAVNGQRAGAIKVDPSGKYLWITNRNNEVINDPGPPLDAGASDAGGDASADAGHDAGASDAGDAGDAGAAAPVKVFASLGENNVALFSIDQTTGEPTFVAAWDTHGIEPRTFTVDPAHRFLIVGNQKQEMVRQGAALNTILPNVAVFQVAVDGQLTFVKSYDQTSGEVVWVGNPVLP